MNDQNQPTDPMAPADDQNQTMDPMVPTDNPVSADEQELAKVLDDINQQVDSQASQIEEQTVTNEPTDSDTPTEASVSENIEPADQFMGLNQQLDNLSGKFKDGKSSDQEAFNSATKEEQNAFDKKSSNQEENDQKDESVSIDPALNDLKQSALKELKPLVNKLNLSNEEKFEIQLLLIRSTDDKALLDSAYETARLIENEEKRAQALLDVIKEVDYFSNKK